MLEVARYWAASFFENAQACAKEHLFYYPTDADSIERGESVTVRLSTFPNILIP